MQFLYSALSSFNLNVLTISELFSTILLFSNITLSLSRIFSSNFSHLHFYFSLAFFETAIHDFVTSRLDSRNSIFPDLLTSTLSSFQVVQNYFSHLTYRYGMFAHITSILRDFHWLRIQLRSHFKTLLMAYKILYHLSPS